MEYETNVSGAEMVIELGSMKHIACCDCGLDHLFIFGHGPKKNQITITVYRDDSQTQALRRAERFTCRPKKK